MKKFLYRLFFTSDDGLDLNYVFFLLLIGLFGYVIISQTPLEDKGWDVFQTIFLVLALLSSPVWLAKLVVDAYTKTKTDKNDSPPAEG